MSEITTDRLKILPVAAEDIDALHALWTDREMRRYIFADLIIPREQVEAMVAASNSMFASHGVGFFALRQRDADNVMGFCGFRLFEGVEALAEKTSEAIPDVELLYGILPDYWGEGLINEAATAVLRHAFEECDIEKIIAVTDTPNQRSVNVLQRLGMSFLGRREFHGLDRVFYTLTREEFEEFHSGADD
ncbi:MAG: GNAT family N-acetyltransferase [Gammaproteobacteria bacterium]